VPTVPSDLGAPSYSNWPDPTPEMLGDVTFNAIWSVIKSWDVAVPDKYFGYMGPTGNHVRAILEAIREVNRCKVFEVSK
jgi:hypothetical protein